jgi:HEAT repeat protein
MPNGNTALGLDSMGAMEITPGGKVVHRIQTSSVKPAQGLVILENDGRNNNLWEYGLRDSRPPVVRLRNGNTLMTYSKNGAERIEEVTASYKVVWDVITLREPPRRYRLRVCLGLLRLGFDQPRPANLDLNSLAHRLERLTDRDPEMRRVAAYDLAELGPNATPAIAVLIEALADPDPSVWAGICSALSKIGPAVIPYLIKATKDERVNVRAAAFRVLHRFTDASHSLVPLFLDGLKDNHFLVRRSALQALSAHLSLRRQEGRLLSPSDAKLILPSLSTALKDSDREGTGQVDHFVGIPVPLLACRILGDFGALGSDAIPSLVPLLKDKDLDLQCSAIGCLGRIGAASEVAVPALLAALGSAGKYDLTFRTRLRRAIVCTLGQIGPPAGAANPALADILANQQRDAELRIYAATALGTIGLATPTVLSALTHALEDPNSEVRERAAESLARVRARK